MKVKSSISVMPLGMIILVRPEQPKKAPFPILFICSGRLIDVILLQPENTLSSMVVTLFGMETEVRAQQQEHYRLYEIMERSCLGKRQSRAGLFSNQPQDVL